MKLPEISIIIPCYNGSEFILDTLQTILIQSEKEIEVIVVDDGSTDDTCEVLHEFSSGYDWIRVISLTRNFGKEAALTAGLDFASGDAIIFMDADLQHPPEVIKKMIFQ